MKEMCLVCLMVQKIFEREREREREIQEKREINDIVLNASLVCCKSFHFKVSFSEASIFIRLVDNTLPSVFTTFTSH